PSASGRALTHPTLALYRAGGNRREGAARVVGERPASAGWCRGALVVWRSHQPADAGRSPFPSLSDRVSWNPFDPPAPVSPPPPRRRPAGRRARARPAPPGGGPPPGPPGDPTRPTRFASLRRPGPASTGGRCGRWFGPARRT